MSVDMKKIGELFKGKREEMNLTLKEVENATSIRTTYLQAIEEGQVDKFISSVYAVGFVKQYASFLGFNGDKLVEDNPKAFSKIVKEKQDFDYGIGTLEQRNPPSGGVKWMPNFMLVALSLGILVLGWYIAKWFNIF